MKIMDFHDLPSFERFLKYLGVYLIQPQTYVQTYYMSCKRCFRALRLSAVNHGLLQGISIAFRVL